MTTHIRGAPRSPRSPAAVCAAVAAHRPNQSGRRRRWYYGPRARQRHVQAFRINLWENKASNRCGGCHNAGGQTPNFARNDDVNLAYQAAIALVDLTQPDQSRLVTKVAGGHNCWLASASACGDTMTVWIRNWAGSVAGGGKTIQLQEPPVKDVGASKTFPDSSSLYGSTIWPLVRGQGNCVRCHSPASATAQSPYFAASDVDAAYAAAARRSTSIRPSSPGSWYACA